MPSILTRTPCAGTTVRRTVESGRESVIRSAAAPTTRRAKESSTLEFDEAATLLSSAVAFVQHDVSRERTELRWPYPPVS